MTRTLAAHGGSPAVTEPHPPAWPRYGDATIAAVGDLVERGETFYIQGHPAIDALEGDLRARFGRKHAPLFVSGTDALHAAYFALGLGPGDEVVCPTITYLTTVTPLLRLGAVPVLCDCEYDTGNVTPESLERRLTPRTRAIVVTHMWGHPVDLDGICELADRHGLPVVDDCSHAHGSTYRGQAVGGRTSVSVFSLGTGKLLSGGAAGVLLTDDDRLYERALLLGHHPTQLTEVVRSPDLAPFAQTGFGGNNRPTPIAAVLARSHLERLDELVEQRRANFELLDAALAPLGGLEPMATREDCTRGAWFGYKIRYDRDRFEGLDKKTFSAALRAEGAKVKPEPLGPLHLLPTFRTADLPLPAYRGGARPLPHAPGDLPVSERLHDELLTVSEKYFVEPAGALLRQYAEAFEKVAEGYRDLLGAGTA